MEYATSPASVLVSDGGALPKVEDIPRTRGRLLDLPEECVLPDFGQLEGRTSWVKVRAGYNASGLGLSFELIDKAGPISPGDERSSGVDGVQIAIDTRDTRNVHRATRFCHRFAANIRPGKAKALEVDVVQKPIARAIADPPTVKPGTIQSKAERTLSAAGGSNSFSRPRRFTVLTPRPTAGSASRIKSPTPTAATSFWASVENFRSAKTRASGPRCY